MTPFSTGLGTLIGITINKNIKIKHNCKERWVQSSSYSEDFTKINMLKNLYVWNLAFEVFSEVMFKALHVEIVVKGVFYKIPEGILWTDLKRKGTW